MHYMFMFTFFVFPKKANSKSWPAKNCVHLNPKWKWICTSANTFYFYYVFEIRTVIMLSLSKKCIYMNFYYLERGVEGPPARRLPVYVYAYVSYIYYQIIPASGLCVGREVGGHLWNVVSPIESQNHPPAGMITFSYTGCFFFTGPPPKMSKYKKVNLG